MAGVRCKRRGRRPALTLARGALTAALPGLTGPGRGGCDRKVAGRRGGGGAPKVAVRPKRPFRARRPRAGRAGPPSSERENP